MEESGFQAAPRLVANRYRLGAMSGRGGTGMVWQATDELIGRAVAVKELRPPAGLSAEERALVSRRALREARTAGQIRHPGVIAIHDIVPATDGDDAIYIVMELVTAPTLADILNRAGALPEDRVRTLGVRIPAALDAAHQIGVVHRDIKPGNIMVLPDDQVKLIDFGIAHAMDETRLTRDGIMGSTGYLAPESFHGQDPTPARISGRPAPPSATRSPATGLSTVTPLPPPCVRFFMTSYHHCPVSPRCPLWSRVCSPVTPTRG